MQLKYHNVLLMKLGVLPRIPDCCCVKLMGADSFAAVNVGGLLILFSSFVGSLGSLVSGGLSWELQAGVGQLGT